MGYLTFNTRSDRVVIISSIITRIFLTLCNTGTVTFQPVNKDTCDLFILCILCFVPVIVFAIYLLLFILSRCHAFILFFAQFHLFFVRLLLHCSLSKRKRLNSYPGLYSRYFDPVQVPVVRVQQLYLLNKNTIIIYASQ
jgi:hypothetical protein